ncbi:serpin family protein [Thermoplasmatota archaeon]
MKMKYIGGIFIILIILISASIVLILNQQNVPDDNEDNSDIIPNINLSSEAMFHETANNFGFELLQQFIINPDYNENPFFSPYSIFSALAMTYEGAEGNTADEMAEVLKIEQDNESFHNYVKYLYNIFNQNNEYNISTANALWIEQTYQVLDQYIDIVEDFYNAESENIDFSKPELAADIINQWVENKTNDLIQNLITPDAITPDITKLILTNAIYFKGTWKIQFDKENTTDRPFTISPGETINVPTMHLIDTEDIFNYTETDEFQMLELPYSGNNISMIIMLPKENNDPSTIINSISDESYGELLDSMEEVNVDIYLPKFNITTPLYSMVDMLYNLGIHDAFTYDADFSGISGNYDLFIKDVIHKAFIEVNEEGTEAAAATGVIMDLKSMPGEVYDRIIFNCNHEFLYLIQENETGTILFMGVMNDPML